MCDGGGEAAGRREFLRAHESGFRGAAFGHIEGNAHHGAGRAIFSVGALASGEHPPHLAVWAKDAVLIAERSAVGDGLIDGMYGGGSVVWMEEFEPGLLEFRKGFGIETVDLSNLR